MVTLIWALALLVNNSHALEKAYEELDKVVGRDRHVNHSDLKDLVYLQAIVKETLRLYPASPLVHRALLEDCTLSAGYHIPADTRVMINVWKIQRDERMWPNANEFQPERYFTTHKDVDMRGQNYELLPFGTGRRSCAGMSLALQMVHLGLASFLQSFNVAKPSNEAVDMTESVGLTNLKATPLDVLITPRLDSQLYV